MLRENLMVTEIMYNPPGPAPPGGSEQDFEFLKPVKPGDVITTTGKIVEIAAKGNNDVITYEARSKNQDGELVTIGRATFVIRGGN